MTADLWSELFNLSDKSELSCGEPLAYPTLWTLKIVTDPYTYAYSIIYKYCIQHLFPCLCPEVYKHFPSI